MLVVDVVAVYGVAENRHIARALADAKYIAHTILHSTLALSRLMHDHRTRSLSDDRCSRTLAYKPCTQADRSHFASSVCALASAQMSHAHSHHN